MEDIFALFIPLGICVILPITCVALNVWMKNHRINKKTEILLKAIEHGQEINPELFTEGETEKNVSVKRMLLNKMQNGIILIFTGLAFLGINIFKSNWGDIPYIAGAILTAVGAGFLVAFFTGKKMMSAEIKAEDEKIRK